MILSILTLSILFSSMPLYRLPVVNAQVNSAELESIAKDFIETLEENEDISIKDPNVEVVYNDNGTISIQRRISENEFEVYTTLSQEEISEISTNPNERVSLPAIMKSVGIALRVSGAISSTCRVITAIADFDVCGYILANVIANLPLNKEVEVSVTRTLVKETCPYPPHSAACNQPPFAYWKTTYSY